MIDREGPPNLQLNPTLANLDQLQHEQNTGNPVLPVFFGSRLAVNAFLRKRIMERRLTPAMLQKELGISPSIASQLIGGRKLISRSRHFYELCALLKLTPEERQGIVRTEQSRSWQ